MFNWVDWSIIAVIAYEIYTGWKRGFVLLLIDLLSFLASLWLGVRFHGSVGVFITEKFGVASSWSDVIGYLVIAFVSQTAISYILHHAIRTLPQKIHTSKVNHWLGAVLSAGNGLIVVSFFLLLILAFPLRGAVKQDIQQSVIGSWLVALSDRYGGNMRSSLDQIRNSAVKFMSVDPGSNERIPLNLPEKNVAYSENAAVETAMVNLVNQERAKNGIPALVPDAQITLVAREKSRDMFVRKYFSHYDPDGKNASDRMSDAGVAYSLVGENLAYAPDLSSAHQGLLNSEGHKKNMMEPTFHRIGIGVIDGGSYGMMFTQIFAD